MRFRDILAATLFLLASATAALGANCKIDEFITKKGSGTTNLQVVPSASVRVYNPGATLKLGGYGYTLKVYSAANFAPGDTLELNGLTATVDTSSGDTITVFAALAWSVYDRALKVSSPVTIYYDSGGTVPITQPALADTTGRVQFYIDCTARNEADLKSSSGTTRVIKTLGMAMTDQGIAHLGQPETFTGNKVFSGTFSVTGAATLLATQVSTFRATGAALFDSTIGTVPLPVGAITGTTAAFSGTVTAGGVVTATGFSGTTGTFSGAVSGTTGAFSGAVSGTTGTFSGDINAGGGFRKLVGPWHKANVTGTVTGGSNNLGNEGVDSVFLGFIPPRAGSLTGISTQLSASKAGGSFSVYPSINGVICEGLRITIPDGSFSGYASVNKDVCTFPAGQVIILKFDTTSFTPTTADLQTWLELEF